MFWCICVQLFLFIFLFFRFEFEFVAHSEMELINIKMFLIVEWKKKVKIASVKSCSCWYWFMSWKFRASIIARVLLFVPSNLCPLHDFIWEQHFVFLMDYTTVLVKLHKLARCFKLINESQSSLQRLHSDTCTCQGLPSQGPENTLKKLSKYSSTIEAYLRQTLWDTLQLLYKALWVIYASYKVSIWT